MSSEPSRVFLPSPYGCSCLEVHIADARSGWRRIRPEFRKGDALRIPPSLIAPSARVSDEARYRILQDGSLECGSTAIEPGGIAIVLESPHTAEFGPGLTAIRPLNRGSTKRLFAKRLSDLLRRAGSLSGVEIAGRQVVLINAVQYQCSLHAFMSADVGYLQCDVRDATWSTLFEAGGDRDLLGRLGDCAPALVLLAPTKGIRQKLVDFIGGELRPWPWMRIDRHPSGWATVPNFGRLAPHGGFVAMPSSDPAAFRRVTYPTPPEERRWRRAGTQKEG